LIQGQRYFQCAPGHGVFTKLNRISKDPPLEPPPLGTPVVVNKKASYTVLTPTQAPHTPVMSRSTSVEEERTPSPSPSHRSTITGSGSALKIGQRVIIANSSGAVGSTKIGILRYLGEVDFQTGMHLPK